MAGRILVDSFFQANTVRGHRYLDDAGKIMNRWDSDFPNKDVGIAGLLMRNPKATMRELRVDNRTIWIHFNFPKTVKQILELSINTTEEICEIIDVKQFSRLGFRLHFVYAIGDPSTMIDEIASKMFNSTCWQMIKNHGSASGFDFAVPLSTKGASITLHITIIKKKPEVEAPKDFPESGILFDVDIFRDGNSYLDDMRRFMKSAKKWVDEELPIIEKTLLEGIIK